MAIITWDDDGSQYYVPDTLLYAGDSQAAWAVAIPLAKWQAMQRLEALQSQLTNFPEPSDAELLDFARQTHHAYVARRQIAGQIEIVEQELAAWPSR